VCFHTKCCSIISAMNCVIFFHRFYAFLYCCHCFLLLHSYTTSTIYCFVISILVIHSYKILLFIWYFTYHICMYVAIATIKLYLSINDIKRCIGENKIAQKVNIVDGLICSILSHIPLKEYLNLYNKTNKCTCL